MVTQFFTRCRCRRCVMFIAYVSLGIPFNHLHLISHRYIYLKLCSSRCFLYLYLVLLLPFLPSSHPHIDSMRRQEQGEFICTTQIKWRRKRNVIYPFIERFENFHRRIDDWNFYAHYGCSIIFPPTPCWFHPFSRSSSRLDSALFDCLARRLRSITKLKTYLHAICVTFFYGALRLECLIKSW